MQKNDNDFHKKVNELLKKMQNEIFTFINDSYNKNPKLKQYNYITQVVVEKWKNDVQQKIKEEMDKLISDLKEKKGNGKKKENNNKKLIKIETQSTLNNFTSKNIQDENKEITRNFQNEAFKYMNNPNENIENETISLFLKEVARISRIAYNESKKLIKKMQEKYRPKKHFINDEESRKEFSSWVKNLEKEKGKKEFENYIGPIKLFEKLENNEQQKYLSKLFNDLTIMYFHCDLAFPLVSIDFKKEDKFISDKMIDFINTGNDRKVNFIILPSLFSNGNYLENGKSWVFTYHKNTFKFEDSEIEILNQLIEKEKEEEIKKEKEKEKEDELIEPKNDDLDVQVSLEIKEGEKFAKIISNKNIFENKDYEIILHLINKTNKKTTFLRTRQKTVKIGISQDIQKYEVVKILFFSDNILVK